MERGGRVQDMRDRAIFFSADSEDCWAEEEEEEGGGGEGEGEGDFPLGQRPWPSSWKPDGQLPPARPQMTGHDSFERKGTQGKREPSDLSTIFSLDALRSFFFFFSACLMPHITILANMNLRVRPDTWMVYCFNISLCSFIDFFRIASLILTQLMLANSIHELDVFLW